jgi:pimeloyl-ACP methyl ester carboxylesterase
LGGVLQGFAQQEGVLSAARGVSESVPVFGEQAGDMKNGCQMLRARVLRGGARWLGAIVTPLALSLSPFVRAAASSGAWCENWESAPVGTYVPAELPTAPYRTFIQTGSAYWVVDDTISHSSDCGPPLETAEILTYGGSKVLKLTSIESGSECADNVWVDAFATLSPPSRVSLPLNADTTLSFYEIGQLVNPGAAGPGCALLPCGDKIYLALADNRSNDLIYVLQRADNDSPFESPLVPGYKEIFLDPGGGYYSRNLFADFSSIRGSNAVGNQITAVSFSVDEHGWAILDDLAIGGAAFDVIDPNPDLLDPDGEVIDLRSSANIDQLASANTTKRGVVADGVTQLLLRVAAKGAVTFSLPSGTLMDGSLGPVGGTGSPSTTVRVNPVKGSDGRSWAFALYTSPVDFIPVDGVRRTLNLTAAGTFGSVPKTLSLERPPVVLVHGVWSSGSAWRRLQSYLTARGFTVPAEALIDYAEESAGSFDPYSRDHFVVDMLSMGTEGVLRGIRSQGIAATQVDVVGHSMGGLVARSRVATLNQPLYLRRENFRKGDFHKIITVGTPHRGTPLADWLLTYKCDRLSWFGGHPTIEQWFEQHGRPLGAAIYGFQTASVALKNIGATAVPSSAIVGIAPDNSGTEFFLNRIPAWSGHPETTVDLLLGGNGNHDTIVTVESQRGGLGGGASRSVSGVVHTSIALGDVSETESTAVWEGVVERLRTSVGSPLFGTFGNVNSTGTALQPTPCPGSLRAAASPPGSGQSALLESGATVTLTPAPGTIVHPGDALNSDFSIVGGNAVEGALLAVGRQLEIMTGAPPFALSYIVPADRLGRIEILADTFGPGPENYSASTYVLVQALSPLTALSVEPRQLSLTQIGQHYRLHVSGVFADGTTNDLTAGDTGTSYATLTGSNSVISVSTNGLIEARGLGGDTVVILNQGLTARAVVSVTNPPPAPPSIVRQPQGQVAVPGAGVVFTVQAEGSVPLYYQWYLNGHAVAGATLPSLSLGASQPGDLGRYTVVVTNRWGAVTSAVATLAAPETVKPTVTITSPAAGARLTSGAITIKGTAKDNVAVACVWWQLNAGSSTAAVGTAIWTADVGLAPGTNAFRVYAVDSSGNFSVTNQTTYDYALTARLTVVVDGVGAVTPKLDGQNLELGRSYTITAKPGNGYVFSGWGGDVAASTPALTFIMRSNLVLRAVFIPSPFIPLAGNYAGLFLSTDTNLDVTAGNNGFFTASVEDSGSFTAKLRQGVRMCPLSGQFSLAGSWRGTVTGGASNLSLSLQLDLIGRNTIVGQVDGGAWMAELVAVLNARTNGESRAGNYTLVLSGSEDAPVFPGGFGFGTVKLTKSGAVSLGGTLGDGTKITESTFVSRTGHWPLYASLYSGRGLICGWLMFTNTAANDIEGVLRWVKPGQVLGTKIYPNGFAFGPTNGLAASGSYWTNRTPLFNWSNGVVVLENGNLRQSIVNPVGVAANGKVTDNAKTNGLSLKIATASGLFSASMTQINGAKKTLKFSGALNLKSSSGYGMFLGTDETGSVFLGARP